MTPRDTIHAALVKAARALGAPEPIDPLMERPRDTAHGHWSSNVAMTLAKPLRRKPRELADAIVASLDLAAAGVAKVEIAGPGFINFHLVPAANASGLTTIIGEGAHYGHSNNGGGKPVNVEFVSANPTGPLHVGHGRQAALGDAIARLLEAAGWKVSREYYYNDAGAQITNLGLSVQARIAQAAGRDVPVPDGGYQGEYVTEIAGRYTAAHPKDAAGADVAAITSFAVAELRKEQDLDLQAFGIAFDTYFLESSLYTGGQVDETVKALVDAGHTYAHDGAVWLRTTQFGDDKDRVMRKKDGTYTYFLPDVAYHVTKWRRGFKRAIDVQGSDHHSTVTRVRAGLQALELGIPPGYPEYVLHQMVTLLRGGEEVKFSKRTGNIVTVRELIDEVGRDATRYFFLMRKADSSLVFDIDLARSQSEDNPVYYVQMAHARMSGIFRVGEIEPASITGAGVDLGVLSAPEEQELIAALLDFPDLVSGAVGALEPHRIAGYLHDTASLVHTWYHKHHVLDEPEAITNARLVLARAAREVLRNGLALLGITAPDRM
jgi:arginyl-tRNA synthetase